MAVWFNEAARDILSQPRTWQFLTDPLTLEIVDSVISIPAGVSEVVSIQTADIFFSKADQLSAQDAAKPGAFGYTLDAAGNVTLYPAMTGSATVTVEQGVITDYIDNADTIFPLDFENLFLSGVMKNAFYTDKDGRFTAESLMYQQAMGNMRAWDNRRKPAPKWNPHGYVRGGGSNASAVAVGGGSGGTVDVSGGLDGGTF